MNLSRHILEDFYPGSADFPSASGIFRFGLVKKSTGSNRFSAWDAVEVVGFEPTAFWSRTSKLINTTGVFAKHFVKIREHGLLDISLSCSHSKCGRLHDRLFNLSNR